MGSKKPGVLGLPNVYKQVASRVPIPLGCAALRGDRSPVMDLMVDLSKDSTDDDDDNK